tara:strand:- start:33572 stop:34621 length:1050 start_codon:yes stop_codon:yes gene_type:complete
MRGVWGVAFLLGIFSVWVLIASVWNFIEINTLSASLGVLAVFHLGLFSYVIFLADDALDHDCIETGLIAGFGFAFIAMCIGLIYSSLTGGSLFGDFTYDPLTPLNDSAIVMSLFLWPTLPALWRRSRWFAIFGFMLVFGLLALLSSFAAICAVVVGGAVFLLRLVMRHNLMAAVLALMVIVMIAIPNLYSALDFEPDINENSTVLEREVHTLIRHRLAIWSFVVKKIEEQPLLGWGFRSSREIPHDRESVSAGVDVLPLHPHNISLQSRLELGLPGSVIFAALVGYVLISLSRAGSNSLQAGFLMAPAVMWLFVANVSFGMWQNWWVAVAFLIAILMRVSVAASTRNAY